MYPGLASPRRLGQLVPSVFPSGLFVVPGDSGVDVRGSRGAGGGVVAIVYPIQAAMTRIKATAKNAVTWSVASGQLKSNQP